MHRNQKAIWCSSMFISNYYWQFWCFLSSTTHKNRVWTHLNWFQWASVWVIDLVFKHGKCDAACHVRTTETSVRDKNQHWRRTSSASKNTWNYLCTWPVLQFQTSSKFSTSLPQTVGQSKAGFPWPVSSAPILLKSCLILFRCVSCNNHQRNQQPTSWWPIEQTKLNATNILHTIICIHICI